MKPSSRQCSSVPEHRGGATHGVAGRPNEDFNEPPARMSGLFIDSQTISPSPPYMAEASRRSVLLVWDWIPGLAIWPANPYWQSVLAIQKFKYAYTSVCLDEVGVGSDISGVFWQVLGNRSAKRVMRLPLGLESRGHRCLPHSPTHALPSGRNEQKEMKTY